MRQTLLLAFMLTFYAAYSADFTSVTDGNWSSPLTWGETMIIPQPGDNVTINHTVTLDDLYTYEGYWSVNAGSITIAENGVLQAGANVLGIAIQNNGSIVNNGVFNMPQIGNYSGSFTNNGTCELSQLLYNANYFENNGNNTELDSVWTTGEFYNNADANFTADSLLIEGSFINSGSLFLHEVTNAGVFTNNSEMEFRRFINVSVLNNYGNMTGTLDMTNPGEFYLYSNSVLEVYNNFLNADSVYHDAVFVAEGTFNIGNNFANLDTVKGINGSINVQDSSANAGWFKQSFEFCDATPLVTEAPYIDFNTGTVEGGIEFCQTQSIENITLREINFFPNPSSSFIVFNHILESVSVYTIDGKLILEDRSTNITSLSIDALPTGLYVIEMKSKEHVIRKPLLVQK